MIGRIRGEVVEQLDDSLVVDVQGVGYVLSVTSSVMHKVVELEANDNQSEIELIVHTVVRENDISLYGFSSALEKRVFLLLQKVKGVGAKVALQIVSTIGAQNLLSAIGQGSLTALCSVSGVGKKTAERIIVELREGVSSVLTEVGIADTNLSKQVEVSTVAQDAVLALEKLGFPIDLAKQAVVAARDELGPQASTEDVLQIALTKAAS